MGSDWAAFADGYAMARVDARRVLSGIVHALRNGGRWADFRVRSTDRRLTLYNRFVLGGARHLGGYSAR